MATANEETGEGWGDRLLTDLASKARLAALAPEIRLGLVDAVRTVAAHKSWAYHRAVSGMDREKGAMMPPRLARAVALLHFHMVDVNAIPMRTDAGALDPAAQPLAALPDGAEAASSTATSTVLVSATVTEPPEPVGQQQLF